MYTFSGLASATTREVIKEANALGMRADMNRSIFLVAKSSLLLSSIPEAILPMISCDHHVTQLTAYSKGLTF